MKNKVNGWRVGRSIQGTDQRNEVRKELMKKIREKLEEYSMCLKILELEIETETNGEQTSFFRMLHSYENFHTSGMDASEPHELDIRQRQSW
jgi:hypothetical protein